MLRQFPEPGSMTRVIDTHLTALITFTVLNCSSVYDLEFVLVRIYRSFDLAVTVDDGGFS